jgi:hypothetical protein
MTRRAIGELIVSPPMKFDAKALAVLFGQTGNSSE